MAEEEERPFKAEYAKSSRAACKQCKGNITKDTLRMAKMVQSPFFDGKQPNWYHFSCFFKTCTLHAISEIAGFSSLRWEDQEKIKKKISGGGGTDSTDGPASSSSSSSSSKKRKITRSDLQVEYAKSKRSSCKGCNSQIDKDEIRIAKMIQPEAGEKKFTGLIPSWHHVDCFLDALADLDAEGVTAGELSGFTKLKKEDKDDLKEKFAAKEDVSAKASGKKRKAAAGDDEPPALKKSKSEVKEEKALREQSQLIWKYHDVLKANLSKYSLQAMLMENHQDVPSGEKALLERCADGMAFGALKRCPKCKGQLILRSHCYQCTGNISAWSKCVYTTDEPERSPWVLPASLREEHCLAKYKYKARKRVFEKAMAPPPSQSQSMDTTDGPGPSQPSIAASQTAGGGSIGGSKVDAPMRGFTVFVIGKFSKSKPVLTRQIEDLGGRVVSKVTDNTTICISNDKEIEKMNKKMCEVEDCDVPVVDEEYLDDAAKGAALLKIPTHTISSWGAARHSLPADDTDYFGGGKSFKSTGPSKVKVTVKGAAAVDPESELEDTHHVLEANGQIWNAVLNMVDVTKGTNSYYKLQLLETDGGGIKRYCVFRSWGRIGTTIGGTKLENFSAMHNAMRQFSILFQEKTGNYWGTKEFVKHPGKFYPLEIDYGAEEDTNILEEAGSKSKLATEVQQLVKMIFNVETMKKALLEFEIDMKKMPLGKLSKRQIQNAYSVLTELQTEISGAKDPTKILDASNRFYTLIPHDFGLRKPPMLDNEDIIRTKTQMLDNLLEIEVAYSLLKQKDASDGGEARDPLDVHFDQLKTDMEVLKKGCDEFQMLQEFVSNTHGATHNQYDLEVMEVFKIGRHGEEKRFKPFSKLHNRMLLWHGSRTTNFVGILSQGLRIAPPEAPATGYMFGKGVYFADMVSKSANYCRTSSADNIGLMLLCEVALGDMYKLTNSEYVTKLPSGKHSTMGQGRTAPDPNGFRTTDSGVVIPMGKGTDSGISYTSLLYNEFIVYDVSQIRMKYLLKMDFKYKW